MAACQKIPTEFTESGVGDLDTLPLAGGRPLGGWPRASFFKKNEYFPIGEHKGKSAGGGTFLKFLHFPIGKHKEKSAGGR